MEAYKKKLTLQRNMGLILGVLLFLGGIIGFYFTMQQPETTTTSAQSYIEGLGVGISIVILAVAILTNRNLKNEERLKKNFIKENDERIQSATKNAFTMGACIILCAIAFASAIAYFFNPLIAITLACVLYFSGLVLLICKIVYLKKS